MPLHVARSNRRTFLAQSAATIAGLTVLRSGWGAEPAANPNLFALLSDTHIPDSPDVTAHDTNMTANLRKSVAEIQALDAKPAAVIVNGDCAYLKGLPADYANFARCMLPLGESGMPLHVTMGNHDDRAPLYEALKAQKPAQELVASKHVSVVESPLANWFLLDSLTEVNVVTGELGEVQREWLNKALASRPNKPALVMVHHNPQFDPPEEGKAWGGIKDTAALMELIARHKHVKALFFGHTHNWSVTRRGDLHLVNLPPVAYVFGAGKPSGWVRAECRPQSLALELRTIDPAHAQHGERVELTWA